MKISLIIPAYNEETCIGACLDSVLKHGQGLHEIIVVDNASTDATSRIASSKPGVRVVYEARQGTSNARQTGAEEATGDIVAYIDADSLMLPGWVAYIERTFVDPEVVLLSGPYRYFDSERFPIWFLNIMWKIFIPPAYWITGYVGNGGNCVVRRNALLAVGGNDRSISFYGDDTDLARRLHRVGKTLWRNNFNILASARRFDEEGLSVYVTYGLNYWWSVWFHSPLTKGFHFLSSQQEN